ncbi:unnamed protein product [Penicillium olsonii]|nr:unnamed protein product [Penicillium olsonii]
MDIHCPPLYSTILTTRHPHWDTQEDASHQAMHSTQPFRPQKYPRLSSNLTELSLQVYEVPNHLASQSQQQFLENYTPPEFVEPISSFAETNQQGVPNSSSCLQAQHVQSYPSFKPKNYKSIAASFTGSNSSSPNATELNMTPSHGDLQAYSELPQVLDASNRQVRTREMNPRLNLFCVQFFLLPPLRNTDCQLHPWLLIVNIMEMRNRCSHITLSHQKRATIPPSKRLIRCKNISLAVPPTRGLTKPRTLLVTLMSISMLPFRLWIQIRTTSDPGQTWMGFRFISSGSNSILPAGRGVSNDTEGLSDSLPNTATPLKELVNGAKWSPEVVAKQAVRKLFGRVRSRTRFSPPSTLKELYQAGFNSLNARTCRDLLVKWMIIMGKTKGSPYVKKPSWWPDNIKYQSARMLCGFEIKTVLFHMFYSKQGLVLFGRFYAARKDVKITKKDEETLAWALYIRSVFKTDIRLRLPEEISVYQ